MTPRPPPTMDHAPSRIPPPLLAALATVALPLAGLLVGYEPVGGDPDTMYRPIKLELARALAGGRLPYWSDRLGLGVPLLAESHAAAFYPPNWLLYRALGVSVAYRLAMLLHHLALAASTYAYARVLDLTPWGAATAAIAFTLCGFQAIHDCHEPFYHVLPYLPLALVLAERFLATGRLVLLPALALTIGLQLTLGHFQLQMFTAGLVLLTALWRILADRRPWPRALALALAVGWGGAIAAPQLVPTWELAKVAGFDRPSKFLSNYSFPPAHWAQPALPRLFLNLRGGVEDTYWRRQQTTGGEACFYVGTVPLILAFVGLAAGRDRALAPWKLLIPITWLLATLPRLWPEGYDAVLQLPGLGYFRCPARYTLMTSLGLALLAGRGLDRAIGPRRFGAGLALAVLFGAASAAWGGHWIRESGLMGRLGAETLPARFGSAALAWGVGLAAIVAWRAGRVGAWPPVLVTAVELGLLFHLGPNPWGPSVDVRSESPALRALAAEPDAGLIAGRLEDIPVCAGLTPAFPYLGIVPPPPNYLLEAARSLEKADEPSVRPWLRRFGVTHGVWEGPARVRGAEVVYDGPDPALDRLVPRHHGAPAHASWRVLRYPEADPPAHVALRVREAADWGELYTSLSRRDDPAEVWYLEADRPPDGPGPRARSATLLGWDGRRAVVAHDGACDLVIRRTFYPGWEASVDGGPARPVSKADGGLQAVRLDGSGTSRVEFRYRPTNLMPAAMTSAVATAAALLAPIVAGVRRRPTAGNR